MNAGTRTTFATCTICEALCGVRIESEGETVLKVLPDDDDVFSQGHICPKGAALGELHHDPDRLRTPVRRTASGSFEPIGWNEAYRIVTDRLTGLRGEHGADAIAIYIGNPVIHSFGMVALRGGLIQALGSRNVTSASSQDTMPRFAASQFLYGCSVSIPVPDIDRTDYLLCLGANPLVSNGSALTAPGIRKRLQGIQERGGRIIVIDPRATETARMADEHHFIRPGGDAALLFGMIQALIEAGKVDEDAIARHASGWSEIRRRLISFTPEKVAESVGISASTIRRLAAEFASTKRSVAYARVGICNNRYGTLASYATDLLNVVVGRLGVEGGSMFPRPVVDLAPTLVASGNDGYGRWRSRVRGLPETMGELPASILAEEMETPGPGQVRALVTLAGNPVLSTPNGHRLEKGIENLEFMVSIDGYINETTRHADIILPPCSHLDDGYFDLFVTRFGVRSIARWSPAVFSRKEEERADWEIALELAYRLGGGPIGMGLVDRFFRAARSIGIRWTPELLSDFFVRIGPFGDRYLPWSKGLNLKKIKNAPHGIDLGPMLPGVSQGVYHRDKKVHLDGAPILRAMDELTTELAAPTDPGMLLLIGRRHLRSNNSWLHNLPSLVSGKARCYLMVHPDDAARLGIEDGQEAWMESRVHGALVPVRVTDEVRPGVVSLPHGWGHARSAQWQQVAGEHAGVSINDWTDDQLVEGIVGQSILNGVPVRLRPQGPSPEDTQVSTSREVAVTS